MSIIQLATGSDWPPTPDTDTNSSNLILALPFNSSYGIRDQSAKIRGSGDSYRLASTACTFDDSASKYYGTSILVGNPDNSSRRVYTTTAIPAFGSSDFCIEGWALVPTLGTGELALLYNHNDTNAGFQVLLLGSNVSPARAIYFSGGGGGSVSQTAASSFPLNQWVHFAVTRQSSTLRIFINGINSVSSGGSISGNFTGSFPASIANNSDTTYNSVRLQDFRIYQGVAKYTSNFTPPGAMFT